MPILYHPTSPAIRSSLWLRFPRAVILLILWSIVLHAPAMIPSANAHQANNLDVSTGPQYVSTIARTQVIADQFNRTLASGWGASDVGGTYAVEGNAVSFGVNGAEGTVLLAKAGDTHATYLPDVSIEQPDLNLRMRVDKPATGSGHYAFVIARHVSTNTEYRGRIRFAASGGIALRVNSVVDGRSRALSPEKLVANLSYTPGSWLRIRMQLQGTNPTTLRMRVWLEKQTEPTTWQYLITDAEPRLQLAGTVGMRTYIGASTTNVPIGMAFDDFQVSQMGLSEEQEQIDNTLSLRDTNYPIPSDAVFVASNGDDSHAGTLQAPWRTLRHALRAAPAKATVVFRQGTYREGDLTLTGKTLTLQPYPHEQVWFKGSLVVTDWIQEGSLWRKDNWRYRFDHSNPTGKGIDPAYPLAGYADMMFVDGQPLRQVGSRADVVPSTFFVDYSTQRLYIGGDPRNHVVEATAQAQALLIRTHGTVIRGLGFLHYATPIQDGAVRGRADRLLFEHNIFAYNAAAGLSVVGVDAVVRGNTSVYNGQLGLHAARAHRLVLEGNTLSYNNQEHFTEFFEQGGAKIARSRDMVWRDNIVEHNLGTGLWCDLSCYHVTIVRNLIRYNTLRGLVYELSSNALIASNVVVGNQVGININESSDTIIVNNTLVENQVHVRVIEGNRRSDKAGEQGQSSWDVHNIIIQNNILFGSDNVGKRMLLVDDYSADDDERKAGATMVSRVDYNAYFRSAPNAPGVLILWSQGATGDNNYRTLAAVQAAGLEHHGLIFEGSTDPFFVNAAAGDYRLRPNSLARGHGGPLPAGVAAVLNVSAGEPLDLGAIAWPQP